MAPKFPVAIAILMGIAVSTIGAAVADPLVFVSRQIPSNGSIYWAVPKDMPGVGPHSRFRVASPGRLLVREADATIRVLIDGVNPTADSANLIDVNAPDVSYDGTRIVFAGLPAETYDRNPVNNPGAWRIYTIGADGSGLRQVTVSDQDLDLSQFGGARGGLQAYDDTDPAWLPDGRIVFSSTRWPSYAQYSGVRTTNLYVVNADGSGLHRITAERNGADRPQIDPVTGKIVYARWWRNHRFALNDMTAVPDPAGGYIRKDGLSANRDVEMDGSGVYADYLWRNVWNPATINPDGTELKAWGGSYLQTGDGGSGHVYGGGFSPSGDLFANFFPMMNMTEASGFGGIRRYSRGPQAYSAVIGITEVSQKYVSPANPTSYGISPGSYASDASPLSNGTFVISWASGVDQDYGLYQINADGSGRTLIYDPSTGATRHRGGGRESSAATSHRSVRSGRHVHVRRVEHLRQRAGRHRYCQRPGGGFGGDHSVLPGPPEDQPGVVPKSRLADPAGGEAGERRWLRSNIGAGESPVVRTTPNDIGYGAGDARSERRVRCRPRCGNEFRPFGSDGEMRRLSHRPHDDPGACQSGRRRLDQSGSRSSSLSFIEPGRGRIALADRSSRQ
jgi:hypothetical protein